MARNFYSAGEFREWYSMGDREWIAPGESVTDTNNYGARPVLWAYWLETDNGEEFLFSRGVPGMVLDG